MKYKTNLHMHTGDDPMDPVGYSTMDAIDFASRKGFEVLALTCHRVCAWTSQYAEYAANRGVLLLSGIELNVDERKGKWGRHVLLIGADKDAENIRTFDDLGQYKADNPHVLIIAPHPYFYGNFSLHEYLDKYIYLFDAIEHSWFYSHLFNRNRQAVSASSQYNLPLVATSDTHFPHYLDANYCLVEAEEKTERAVLEAVKMSKIENITSPRKFFSEMLIPQAGFSAKTLASRLQQFLKPPLFYPRKR